MFLFSFPKLGELERFFIEKPLPVNYNLKMS